MKEAKIKKKYDVCIIGAGIAGICAAYELSKNTNLSILLIEKGNDIRKRKCHKILTTRINRCLDCKDCDLTTGFGGAGCFSGGKFNMTTEFGGNLADYIGEESTENTIKYVDEIITKFGEEQKVFDGKSKFADDFCMEALKYDLHLTEAKIKHLGIENNVNVLLNMYEYLKYKVDIFCNTEVIDIMSAKEKFTLNILNKDLNNVFVTCKYLIAAPGKEGSNWLKKQFEKLDIQTINGELDIGVRVELPEKVMHDITENLYEAKLHYLTKSHNKFVRIFDMNPYGYVVNEKFGNFKIANGHSCFLDEKKHSKNTNFALLVSLDLEGLNKNLYAETMALNTSIFAGNDNIIVQRYADLKAGRATTEKKLSQSTVKPTYDAVPGNLGLVMPKDILDNIIETLEVLNKLIPGVTNADTLLYGVEVKLYSDKPEIFYNLELNEYANFYVIGDGSGIIRGLAQAGASGIVAARSIIENEKSKTE